ncbi:MAG: PucR family transcriptional regulator ligand-binding domain-containing protein [Actinomycetota bacterium]|nr:PucR family transcriptional regulator ligand-binding domain-containing protein [Actinomycetota bacterium]
MLSVRDVLALPPVVAGLPRVVAGRSGLDAPVRWVHVSEVADIADLLQGGELILTTGIALPDDARGLARYVEDLAGAGACGIVVELGRHFTRLPGTMARAAERRGLPLVELRAEVPYVAVTEAVHSRIVNAHVDELRQATEVHEVFTSLSLEGASVEQIVREVAERARCAAVLENLSHQVLAHSGGDPERLLSDWERRSRAVALPERTAVAPPEGWLVTRIATKGEPWGRLVLLLDGEPTPGQRLVAERGASAIAIERLAERDRESFERHVHRNLLADLVSHATASPAALAARASALGVPLEGRQLAGMVVRFRDDVTGGPLALQAADLRRAELTARAARSCRAPAIVGALRPSEVGLLVSLHAARDAREALSELALRVRSESGDAGERRVVVAAGSVVARPDEARRTLLEAVQVASVADDRPVPRSGYVALPDVRIRGLLYLLREDARLQGFVERELGALLVHDASSPDDRLVDALGALCRHGGNVAAAARDFGLSRAAYYHRLERIEAVAGVRLEAVESLLSLQVALLALATIRSGDPARRV